MRIVSLLPAATEWVCALGAEDALVGRSHECDFPASVQDVPVVTRATYDDSGDSAAIDEAVRDTVQQGLSLYEVDLDRLDALAPDLILTQAQCEVCAVSLSGLQDALNDRVDTSPEIFSMQPQTLKEVFNVGLRLGRRLGRLDAAMQVIGEGERRLQRLRTHLGVTKQSDPETFPTVACIEWMQPLMTAGHWMPDLADLVGARAVLAEGGGPSPTISWDALREADPDVLALLPCGFSIDATRRDLSYLTEREGWADLTAVQSGCVALLDGNAYFNRPGPRLYRAAELLASVVHADADLDAHLSSPPQPWERRWLEELETPAH